VCGADQAFAPARGTVCPRDRLPPDREGQELVVRAARPRAANEAVLLSPSQNFTSNERWLGLPNSAFNTARHRDTASSSIRAAADCSSACAVDMIRKLWVSDSIVHTACDQMVRHRTNRVEHSVSGAWYGCHRIEQPPQIPRRDRAIRRPLRTDLLHSLRCRQFAQAIRSLDSFLNS